MLAGWDPDETSWLTDVLQVRELPTRWRQSQDAPTRWDGVGDP